MFMLSELHFQNCDNVEYTILEDSVVTGEHWMTVKLDVENNLDHMIIGTRLIQYLVLTDHNNKSMYMWGTISLGKSNVTNKLCGLSDDDYDDDHDDGNSNDKH